MYSTDRGTHRVERNKLMNKNILLNLFVRKCPKELIIGSSLHRNDKTTMLITKLVKEMK